MVSSPFGYAMNPQAWDLMRQLFQQISYMPSKTKLFAKWTNGISLPNAPYSHKSPYYHVHSDGGVVQWDHPCQS